MGAVTHSEARRWVSRGREASIQDLHRLNDRRRVFDLAVCLCLWAVGSGIACVAWANLTGLPRVISVLVGWLLSAVAINAQLLLVHEGMHLVLFKNRAANRWCSVVLGWSFLMSHTAYQVQHLRHHAFLGKAGDPDEYGNYTQPGWKLWALQCLRICAGSYLYLGLIPFLSWRKARGSERRKMLEEYLGLILVVLVAVKWVPMWILIQTWFGPLLFVNFMVNLRGLTQHSLSEPADAFIASRNTQSGALLRFCLLSENYHLAHHLYPHVPSYALHGLNDLLKDRYRREATGPGYLWFLGRFLKAMLQRDFSPIGIVEHKHVAPHG